MNVVGVLVSRDRTVYEWRGTRARSLMREIGMYTRMARGWEARCVDCDWHWGGGRARDVVADLRDHFRAEHRTDRTGESHDDLFPV